MMLIKISLFLIWIKVSMEQEVDSTIASSESVTVTLRKRVTPAYGVPYWPPPTRTTPSPVTTENDDGEWSCGCGVTDDDDNSETIETTTIVDYPTTDIVETTTIYSYSSTETTDGEDWVCGCGTKDDDGDCETLETTATGDYSSTETVATTTTDDCTSIKTDKTTTTDDYSSTKADKTTTTDGYSSAKTDKTTTTSDYFSTTPVKTSTNGDYYSTKTDKTTTTDDYSSTKADKTTTTDDYSSIKTDKTTTADDYYSITTVNTTRNYGYPSTETTETSPHDHTTTEKPIRKTTPNGDKKGKTCKCKGTEFHKRTDFDSKTLHGVESRNKTGDGTAFAKVNAQKESTYSSAAEFGDGSIFGSMEDSIKYVKRNAPTYDNKESPVIREKKQITIILTTDFGVVTLFDIRDTTFLNGTDIPELIDNLSSIDLNKFIRNATEPSIDFTVTCFDVGNTTFVNITITESDESPTQTFPILTTISGTQMSTTDGKTTILPTYKTTILPIYRATTHKNVDGSILTGVRKDIKEKVEAVRGIIKHKNELVSDIKEDLADKKEAIGSVRDKIKDKIKGFKWFG